MTVEGAHTNFEANKFQRMLECNETNLQTFTKAIGEIRREGDKVMFMYACECVSAVFLFFKFAFFIVYGSELS